MLSCGSAEPLPLVFLVLMLSKVHSIVLSFHDWLHLAFMLAVFV